MGRAGVVIAGLVMCGLLVSACSSGSSGSSAAPEKTSPARVPTETVQIGRFTQIFDASLPADPARADVVEGFRADMILWDRSQEDLTLVSPVTAYVSGAALGNLKASLVRTTAQKVVLGGTDRFFKTGVAKISGSSATITTCDDGSKFEEVNLSTGVPDPAYSAPPDQQYLFETWQMVRLGGHWAISAVSLVMLPDSRADPCQPLPARARRVVIWFRLRSATVLHVSASCRRTPGWGWWWLVPGQCAEISGCQAADLVGQEPFEVVLAAGNMLAGLRPRHA